MLVASAGPEAVDGARFRVPVWPIWSVYAAIGARVAITWYQERRRLQSPHPATHR